MRPRLFILVPAFTPDGPVKGAIALANSVTRKFDTHIVSLKGGGGAKAVIDPDVHVHNLGSIKSWAAKRRSMLALMSEDRPRIAVISYCFSADVFSLALRSKAVLISSVRANNFVNYRDSYGFFGVLLAYVHYGMLRFFDGVYVFDGFMAKQVYRFSGRPSVVIGNFIDESRAESYRSEFSGPNNSESARLVFVGSLTRRKCPLLLARAVARLIEEGVDVSCTFVGDGVLRAELEQFVRQSKLGDRIQLTGFLEQPLSIVSAADVFVLPSISEGAPRAALEALFLGVPCVLRSVDGNGSLISSGVNGELFVEDDQLPEALRRAVCLALELKRLGGRKRSLLAEHNRQRIASSIIIRDLSERI